MRHNLHPEHPLHEVNDAGEFKCNGCNALGHGKSYRCSTCDFDLHERCATCPPSLFSHHHEAHSIVLVNQSLGRDCDLCGKAVHGQYYTCQACEFDVHPLCTELPATVRHAAHHNHLTLRAAEPRNCTVCGQGCGSRQYISECGSVAIHLECALPRPVAVCQIQTAPVYYQWQYAYFGGFATPFYRC